MWSAASRAARRASRNAVLAFGGRAAARFSGTRGVCQQRWTELTLRDPADMVRFIETSHNIAMSDPAQEFDGVRAELEENGGEARGGRVTSERGGPATTAR